MSRLFKGDWVDIVFDALYVLGAVSIFVGAVAHFVFHIV